MSTVNRCTRYVAAAIAITVFALVISAVAEAQTYTRGDSPPTYVRESNGSAVLVQSSYGLPSSVTQNLDIYFEGSGVGAGNGKAATIGNGTCGQAMADFATPDSTYTIGTEFRFNACQLTSGGTVALTSDKEMSIKNMLISIGVLNSPGDSLPQWVLDMFGVQSRFPNSGGEFTVVIQGRVMQIPDGGYAATFRPGPNCTTGPREAWMRSDAPPYASECRVAVATTERQ